MNDYRRRGWVHGGTALAVGALLLSACGGTSQTDGRLATENQGDSEETTEQNTQTDPMRTAWAVPAMKGMVEDGYELKNGGVSTLVPTLLDYQDGPGELLDRVKEVNDEFGKSETVQQDLNTQLRQQFASGPCTDKMSTLAKRTDAISKSNHDLVELNKTRLDAIDSGQTWEKEQWTDHRKKVATWAAATFADEGGIEDDLKSIAQALAPKTGDGLIAICSKSAITAWDGSPANHYANERPYYDKMLLLQSYYYNAQTTGTNLVMSANYYRARELIRPTQNPIQMSKVGEQLCSEFQASDTTPLGRREACQFAKQAMQKAQTSLRGQFGLTGAGYSYNTAIPQEQAANISALSPILELPAQVWVNDPAQYPNTSNGNDAAHASQLVNTQYAGVDNWRAAGSDQWNQLLGALTKREDFSKNNRNGVVEFALRDSVGLTGYSGRGADGNGAVIWMGEEFFGFGQYGARVEGWCLLIPYGTSGQANGSTVCQNDTQPVALLPDMLGNQWATNQWLNESTINNPEIIWQFGPAATSGNLATTGIQGFRINSDFNYPSWVKYSRGWNSILIEQGTRDQTAAQRSAQVIYPIKLLGDPKLDKCTAGSGTVNVGNVPRMCGPDYTAWINTVIQPLPVAPNPNS